MPRLTARTARLVGWIAVPTALLASGLAIGGASYSAFSATTVNPTNNWTTGTVALSDDDANTALFTASGLKPGSTDSKCIAVTSTGSLASAVKLYGTGASTTNALSGSINLVIQQGTGGTFSGGCGSFVANATTPTVYTGTLANFASTATNYANGLGTWTPTGSGSDTRVYKFTYTVDPSAPNSTQGGTAAIGFTWEAQNS
jgi:hypothetical protein